MSKIVSYQSYDYRPYHSVPVIASFDSDGHIAPLYVRIDGVALKVDSFWIKSSFANRMDFNCKVVDENTLRPLLLSFYQNEGIWIANDSLP